MGQFIGEVCLEPLPSNNGRDWLVKQSFDYKANNGDVVHIEAGEKTDLASTPRLLWVFIPPEGLWTDDAIVHDEGYKQQIFTRKRYDDILMEAMTDSGVDWLTRHNIYWGVRLGGWVAWNQHTKELAHKIIGG